MASQFLEEYRAANPDDTRPASVIINSLGNRLREKGLESGDPDFDAEYNKIKDQQLPSNADAAIRTLKAETANLGNTLKGMAAFGLDTIGFDSARDSLIESIRDSEKQIALDTQDIHRDFTTAETPAQMTQAAITGFFGVLPSTVESFAVAGGAGLLGSATGPQGGLAGTIGGLFGKNYVKKKLRNRLMKYAADEIGVEGIEEILEKSISRGLGKEAAEEAISQMVAKGVSKDIAKFAMGSNSAAWAATAGIADSFAQNTGEIYNNITRGGLENTSRLSRNGAAFGGGVVAGALDFVLPAVIINRVFSGIDKSVALKSLEREFIKASGGEQEALDLIGNMRANLRRAADATRESLETGKVTARGLATKSMKSMPLDVALEGTTEALQTLVGEVAHTFADPTYEIDSKSLWRDMVNSAIMGAMGGSQGTVLGAAVEGLQAKKTNRDIEDRISDVENNRVMAENALDTLTEFESRTRPMQYMEAVDSLARGNAAFSEAPTREDFVEVGDAPVEPEEDSALKEDARSVIQLLNKIHEKRIQDGLDASFEGEEQVLEQVNSLVGLSDAIDQAGLDNDFDQIALLKRQLAEGAESLINNNLSKIAEKFTDSDLERFDNNVRSFVDAVGLQDIPATLLGIRQYMEYNNEVVVDKRDRTLDLMLDGLDDALGNNASLASEAFRTLIESKDRNEINDALRILSELGFGPSDIRQFISQKEIQDINSKEPDPIPVPDKIAKHKVKWGGRELQFENEADKVIWLANSDKRYRIDAINWLNQMNTDGIRHSTGNILDKRFSQKRFAQMQSEARDLLDESDDPIIIIPTALPVVAETTTTEVPIPKGKSSNRSKGKAANRAKRKLVRKYKLKTTAKQRNLSRVFKTKLGKRITLRQIIRELKNAETDERKRQILKVLEADALRATSVAIFGEEVLNRRTFLKLLNEHGINIDPNEHAYIKDGMPYNPFDEHNPNWSYVSQEVAPKRDEDFNQWARFVASGNRANPKALEEYQQKRKKSLERQITTLQSDVDEMRKTSDKGDLISWVDELQLGMDEQIDIEELERFSPKELFDYGKSIVDRLIGTLKKDLQSKKPVTTKDLKTTSASRTLMVLRNRETSEIVATAAKVRGVKKEGRVSRTDVLVTDESGVNNREIKYLLPEYEIVGYIKYGEESDAFIHKRLPMSKDQLNSFIEGREVKSLPEVEPLIKITARDLMAESDGQLEPEHAAMYEALIEMKRTLVDMRGEMNRALSIAADTEFNNQAERDLITSVVGAYNAIEDRKMRQDLISVIKRDHDIADRLDVALEIEKTDRNNLEEIDRLFEVYDALFTNEAQDRADTIRQEIENLDKRIKAFRLDMDEIIPENIRIMVEGYTFAKLKSPVTYTDDYGNVQKKLQAPRRIGLIEIIQRKKSASAIQYIPVYDETDDFNVDPNEVRQSQLLFGEHNETSMAYFDMHEVEQDILWEVSADLLDEIIASDTSLPEKLVAMFSQMTGSQQDQMTEMADSNLILIDNIQLQSGPEAFAEVFMAGVIEAHNAGKSAAQEGGNRKEAFTAKLKEIFQGLDPMAPEGTKVKSTKTSRKKRETVYSRTGFNIPTLAQPKTLKHWLALKKLSPQMLAQVRQHAIKNDLEPPFVDEIMWTQWTSMQDRVLDIMNKMFTPFNTTTFFNGGRRKLIQDGNKMPDRVEGVLKLYAEAIDEFGNLPPQQGLRAIADVLNKADPQYISPVDAMVQQFELDEKWAKVLSNFWDRISSISSGYADVLKVDFTLDDPKHSAKFSERTGEQPYHQIRFNKSKIMSDWRAGVDTARRNDRAKPELGSVVFNKFIHEIGHFIEASVIGHDVTDALWRKLDDDAKRLVYEHYTRAVPKRMSYDSWIERRGAEGDEQLRKEWVAYNFYRIAESETIPQALEPFTQGLNQRERETFLGKLREVWEAIKSTLRDIITGAERFDDETAERVRSRELDNIIKDLLAEAESISAQRVVTMQGKNSKYLNLDKDMRTAVIKNGWIQDKDRIGLKVSRDPSTERGHDPAVAEGRPKVRTENPEFYRQFFNIVQPEDASKPELLLYEKKNGKTDWIEKVKKEHYTVFNDQADNGRLDQIQRAGINIGLYRYLNDERGMLLLDGTGTGKTLQQLILANEIVKRNGGKQVAIVTHDSRVLFNSFAGDAAKVNVEFLPKLTASGEVDYDSADKESQANSLWRMYFKEEPSSKMEFVAKRNAINEYIKDNFERLNRIRVIRYNDINKMDTNAGMAKGGHFDAVIFDEAQNAKNPTLATQGAGDEKARIADSVFNIKANFKVYSSATLSDNLPSAPFFFADITGKRGDVADDQIHRERYAEDLGYEFRSELKAEEFLSIVSEPFGQLLESIDETKKEIKELDAEIKKLKSVIQLSLKADKEKLQPQQNENREKRASLNKRFEAMEERRKSMTRDFIQRLSELDADINGRHLFSRTAKPESKKISSLKIGELANKLAQEGDIPQENANFIYDDINDYADYKGTPRKIRYSRRGGGWMRVRRQITLERERLQQEGAILRREYPIWSDKMEVVSDFTFSQEVKKLLNRLRASHANNMRENRERRANRQPLIRDTYLNDLAKAVELGKAEAIFKEVVQRWQAGEKVVIMTRYIGTNDRLTLETNGEEIPTLIAVLKQELGKLGIPFEVADKEKGGAIERFVNDDTTNGGDPNNRVLMGTMDSLSTGVSLDSRDPRTTVNLMIPSIGYRGDFFAQALGRVSRKPTAAPANYFFFMSDSIPSDARQKTRLLYKLENLLAVSGGEREVIDALRVPSTSEALERDVALFENTEDVNNYLGEDEAIFNLDSYTFDSPEIAYDSISAIIEASKRAKAEQIQKELERKFEVFPYGPFSYDINKAKDLIAQKREDGTIELVEFEDASALRSDLVYKDENHVKYSNIDNPVILATNEQGSFLIDGHHRVEKAFLEGKPIKGYVLSVEDSESIVMGDDEFVQVGDAPVMLDPRDPEQKQRVSMRQMTRGWTTNYVDEARPLETGYTQWKMLDTIMTDLWKHVQTDHKYDKGYEEFLKRFSWTLASAEKRDGHKNTKDVLNSFDSDIKDIDFNRYESVEDMPNEDMMHQTLVQYGYVVQRSWLTTINRLERARSLIDEHKAELAKIQEEEGDIIRDLENAEVHEKRGLEKIRELVSELNNAAKAGGSGIEGTSDILTKMIYDLDKTKGQPDEHTQNRYARNITAYVDELSRDKLKLFDILDAISDTLEDPTGMHIKSFQNALQSSKIPALVDVASQNYKTVAVSALIKSSSDLIDKMTIRKLPSLKAALNEALREHMGVKVATSEEKIKEIAKEAKTTIRNARLIGKIREQKSKALADVKRLKKTIESEEEMIRIGDVVVSQYTRTIENVWTRFGGSISKNIYSGKLLFVPPSENSSRNDIFKSMEEFNYKTSDGLDWARVKQKQDAWLRNPKNRDSDPFLWNQMKAQNFRLSKQAFDNQYYKVRTFAPWMYASLSKMAQRTGMPQMNNVVRMIFHMQASIDSHRNSVMKAGDDSNRARQALINSIDKHMTNEEFALLIDTPSKRFIEQPNATIRQAWNVVITSRPEKRKMLDKPNSYKLFERYIKAERKNFELLKDIAEEMGLKVTDDRFWYPDLTESVENVLIKANKKRQAGTQRINKDTLITTIRGVDVVLKPIERSHFNLGTEGTFQIKGNLQFLTAMRLAMSEKGKDNWSDKLLALLEEGGVFDEREEDEVRDIDFEGEELQNVVQRGAGKGKRRGVNLKGIDLDSIMNDDIYEMFLEPLIRMTNQTAFYGAKQHESMAAWDSLEEKSLSKFLDVLWEDISKKKMFDDVPSREWWNEQVLLKLKSYYNKFVADVINAEATADTNTKDGNQRVGLDSRKRSAYPVEWTGYKLGGVSQNLAWLGHLAFHSAMGKDGVNFFNTIDDAKEDLRSIKKEYELIRNRHKDKSLKEINRIAEKQMGSGKLMLARPKTKLSEFFTIGGFDVAMRRIEEVEENMRNLFQSELGPFKELNTLTEFVTFGVISTLNGPRAAITQLNDLYLSAGRTGVSAETFGSIRNKDIGFVGGRTAQTIAGLWGSMMGSIGSEFQQNNVHRRLMKDIQGIPMEVGQGILEQLDSMVSDMGFEEALRVNDETKIRETNKAMSDFWRKLGLGANKRKKALRMANQLYSKGFSNIDRSKALFDTFNPWAPFTFLVNNLNRSVVMTAAKRFDIMAGSATQWLKDHKGDKSVFVDGDPKKGYVEGFSFDKHRAEIGFGGTWTIYGIEVLNQQGMAWDYYTKEVLRARVGTTIEQVALDNLNETPDRHTDSKSGRKLPYTLDQYRMITSIVAADVTGEANQLTTRTPKSGFAEKLGLPLLGWTINRSQDFAKQFKDPNHQMTYASVATGTLVTGMGLLPMVLAFSLFRDWFDEVIMGKKSNLKPITPDNWFVNTVERFTREGTMGIGGEVVNLAVNTAGGGDGGDIRTLSFDQRIFVANSLRNVIQQAGRVAHTKTIDDFLLLRAPYSEVRPFIQNLGLNGALQWMQMIGHHTGWDNPEVRHNSRSNVVNWLRHSGYQLGMEPRMFSGMAQPTPETPWVTQMQRAAYTNSISIFRDAYKRAVKEAMKNRNMTAEEAKEWVKRSFNGRHPLKNTWRITPTEDEVKNAIRNMSDRGRDSVQQALYLYNKYNEKIGNSEYLGKK